MSKRNRARSRWTGILVVTLALLVPQTSSRAGDEDLFSTTIPPNVMLVVDNSGSMNHIVWHPAFDPSATPTCSNWTNTSTYVYSSTLTITACGNTRTLYPDPGIGGWTRIYGRYLNWLFSDAADAYQTDIASTNNGIRSSCLVAEGLSPTYSKYRRSRISAAKEVLRDVVCTVNAKGDVRFGLAQFYDASDPKGGYVKVPVNDYTASQGAAIESFIENLSGETWTPLAETLYNVYRYFQSRTDPAFGKDGATTFPVYNIRTSGSTSSDLSTVPGSPVQYSCQKHFVIIITDGEPTKDDFDEMDLDGFEDELIGDYNPDNTLPEAGDETPSSCTGCDETSFYLDDIAKFMQENDFQRDFDGDQVIDVYTVGFTTATLANQLLQKTAAVGNGLFFQSNNAEELAPAIIAAVTDIIEKSQAFTSATVPASRTTDGDNFYTSFFLPKGDTGFWEGHLKNFEFSPAGDILTADGDCATGDVPDLSPPCPSGGALRFFDNAFWDAADALPAPGSRKLFLEFGSTAMFAQPTAFSIPPGQEAAAAAAFGLTAGVDDLDEPYSDLSPNTPSDMAVALVDVLRGCEFGSSPCVARVNNAGDKVYLGDIFHSNPVVVGSPNAPINEVSYKEFANVHRTRTRVIYAGANDGFLHGFNAGIWRTLESDGITPLVPPRHDRGTGEELFGFMPYPVRNVIKELPKVTSFPRAMETVDSSPVVADVWFYRNVVSGSLGSVNPLLAPDDVEDLRWRTVLMGGLRDGGMSYYALDVTNPTSSASESSTSYPRYLWGFPCEDCANAVNDSTDSETTYVGYTWSEPVITRVRVAADGGPDPRGYDRWVAIFGAGYFPHGDPNGPDYREPGDAGFEPRGRAIYMVDITTGKVLAKKHFDSSASAPASTKTPQVGMRELRYAFASAPAVFDVDFDGYADVIYIGDLGGNVWKWVVQDVGDDPINNSVANKSLAQPDWPFRLFFRAGTSLEPTLPPEQLGSSYDSSVHYQSFFFPATGVLRQGKLILAFGAGERANPKGAISDWGDGDPTNNNHYYVVTDTNPLEAGAIDPDAIDDAVVEANLDELDDATVLSCADMQATKKGYYITARDAEKFITNSVIFLGQVFTASFLPADPMSSDPCSARGESFLYQFDLKCGTGAFTSNPGTAADKRRKSIGGGVPTRPRVSVGQLNQGGGGGGGGGGCPNKVVVITSDGRIENDCPGSLPSSGISLRSWRER